MSRRTLVSMLALSLIAATGAFTAPLDRTPPVKKWPPWISIESPVNPYDPATRGAALLVHANFREGDAQVSDLSGTAEGLVGTARRSIPLHFESAGRPNVFALRRQWPSEGTWVLRITVKTTTAIASLDRNGNVAAVRVPTERSTGMDLPRAVPAKEIDSLLAESAKR